jgi:hypothetical protein
MKPSSPSGSARRLPRGYVGRNHETIGSDILAVARATSNPAKIFDAESLQQLGQVRSDGWYPIDWLLRLTDQLSDKLGAAGLRKMGRELFKLSHAEHVRTVANSAHDIVSGFDAMYRFANRGDGIGGWKLELFQAGRAELEKTTPHPCVMEEGIMMEALATVGAPSTVTQAACFQKGADACRFVILSTTRGERWSGPAA